MVKRYNGKRKVTKLSKPLRQAVKKMIKGNIETKMVDQLYGLEGAENVANILGSIFYLSGVAEGTSDYERIGSNIRPVDLTVKMMLRFYVLGSSSTTYWGNPMRVVIFSYDCSLNPLMGATLPVPGDILRNQGGALGDSIFKFPNTENERAYTILHDKVYNPRRDNNFMPIKIVIRKNVPKVITYSGNTTTNTGAGRNALFCLVYSYFNEVADTTKAIYTIQSRLRFKDA